MKTTTKWVGGVGAVLVTLATAGTVAFADTNSSSQSTTPSATTNPTKLSAALKSELQADRATLGSSEATNKELNGQIKATLQNWKTAHAAPFKQLTADQQASIKALRADILSKQSDRLAKDGQADTLRSQLITAKQNKDTTSVASLKAQIQPLVSEVKADGQAIQADRNQIAALLPPDAVKSFKSDRTALKSAIRSEEQSIKTLQQTLKTDLQKLKTDRQNKVWTNLDADAKAVNNDLTQLIAAKKQLLANFPSASN